MIKSGEKITRMAKIKRMMRMMNLGIKVINCQVLSGARNSQLGREQYPEYLETTSACEKAIHRDIAR